MTLFSIPVMYHKEAATAISGTSNSYNSSRARRAPIRMKVAVLLIYVRGPINSTPWWVVASRVPGQGPYYHTNLSYSPPGWFRHPGSGFQTYAPK